MRLIDADELIKELKDRIKEAERLIVDPAADKLDEIANTAAGDFITAYQGVIEMLEERPIAYDVDKVVEKLKKVSYERYGNDGMGGELVINLDDAIEIVKGGGIDG